MRRAPFYLASAGFALAVADGIAKTAALEHLSDTSVTPLIPSVAGLLLHRNYGVVANIPIPHWFVIPVSLLIIAACTVWLYRRIDKRRPAHISWQASGMSLLIAGALGNVIDRMVNGFTTDYLILFGRSVINIADVLIVAGLVLVVLCNQQPITKTSQ